MTEVNYHYILLALNFSLEPVYYTTALPILQLVKLPPEVVPTKPATLPLELVKLRSGKYASITAVDLIQQKKLDSRNFYESNGSQN